MATLSLTLWRTDAHEDFYELNSITLPTLEGAVQILPDHAPFVVEIAPGTCLLRSKSSARTLSLASSGLVRVSHNTVAIFL